MMYANALRPEFGPIWSGPDPLISLDSSGDFGNSSYGVSFLESLMASELDQMDPILPHNPQYIAYEDDADWNSMDPVTPLVELTSSQIADMSGSGITDMPPGADFFFSMPTAPTAGATALVTGAAAGPTGYLMPQGEPQNDSSRRHGTIDF
jgi:hypothetical protein